LIENPQWFSQESLTDFHLYVATAQITLEAVKSRASDGFFGLKFGS
jgi:hypothetical protein